MHSEHILKERSDAQNVVSRFPCGGTTLLHNLRRSRYHHTLNPLNLLNLVNPLNPHTEGALMIPAAPFD